MSLGLMLSRSAIWAATYWLLMEKEVSDRVVRHCAKPDVNDTVLWPYQIVAQGAETIGDEREVDGLFGCGDALFDGDVEIADGEGGLRGILF